ncbi:MAG: NAD(P)/FAD-dependent oxidoreductase [Pseudomonadales bacterium]
MDWGSTQHNGSFWFDSLDTRPLAQPPKRLPYQVDVAIIGGGYTGLWTAYYLKQQQPDLNIAIFEAVTVGFGASGRNGGWCMGLAWGIDGMLARPDQRQKGIDLLKAMHDTVDEVGRVSQAENIDCHYAKGGTLNVATVPFRVQQLQEHVARMQSFGFTDDDYRWLPEAEARSRLNCKPNLGAAYTTHCAAIHPARLVRGLGETVRKMGVTIFEQTPVLDLEPGRVRTPHGMVKADVVLRATEGYTDTLPSQRRRLLPVYSMMVATEPLPSSVWEQIGLRHRETFGDGRRLVIYGQRTLDNRFAFGGRAGYYFGSEMKPVIDPAEPLLDQVEANLRGLFPVLKDYKVTNRWGGLMGTSTTWRPSVSFDRARGIGMAGGYVGEGVAASNLAGRVLADLVTGRKTDLTRLAWVNDTARRWVPEPLRWLGVKAIRAIAARADAEEFATGAPSKLWGSLYSRLVG